MEAAYQRTASGKRKTNRTAAMQKGEKRRLTQLIVSLCLFLIVFLGQDVFPERVLSWSEALSENTDFTALFSGLREKSAGDGMIRSLLSKLTANPSVQEPQDENEEQVTLPEAESPEVILLSETNRQGLQYIREHSFLKDLRIELPETTPVKVEEIKAEVVTAVAQTYSPDGEELPNKVSFLFYELGLESTAVPVFGPVTSEFGYRIGPISGKREFHLALDIGAPKGTEIRAFADGVVRYIGENDSFGLYLMIDHDNGVSTFYAHCSKLLVRKGDTITCGQTVAKVGSTGNATGPHLHFTLSKDGIRLDPAYYVDPTETKQG